MNKSKKYYWLKLKEGFFADPKIKKLRKIAGGDTFTIILQKIMLLSIKDGGALEFQHIEPTFAEELALILDEDVDNVKITLSFMQVNGLIESIGEEEFFLPNVPPLIGSETDSAERVRRFREKQKALEAPKLALQCNGEVTTSNTEIEIREKIQEIDKRDKNKGQKPVFVLPDCIDPEKWAEWIAYRKKRRLTCVEETLTGQIKKLEKWAAAGHNPSEIIQHSLDNGYQGLFEPKGKPKNAMKWGGINDQDGYGLPEEFKGFGDASAILGGGNG